MIIWNWGIGKIFFAPENEEYDGFNDEIWVETWLWKDNVVIKDLYAWPGDNQAGAIFIGESIDPLFFIGDMDLESSTNRSNRYCPNRTEDLTDTELEFQKLMDNFCHMRRIFYELNEEGEDAGCLEHSICQQNFKAHENFIKETRESSE